jgi:hypothetical protein
MYSSNVFERGRSILAGNEGLSPDGLEVALVDAAERADESIAIERVGNGLRFPASGEAWVFDGGRWNYTPPSGLLNSAPPVSVSLAARGLINAAAPVAHDIEPTPHPRGSLVNG